MNDDQFLGDTEGLIRPEEEWNAHEAFELVNKKIFSQ